MAQSYSRDVAYHGRMSEFNLYESSAKMRREDAAKRLREIADQLSSANGLELERDGKRLFVSVPSEVTLSVEVEREDDEVEIDIEISWGGDSD
jgi:amphi-Trp domain-containing protein